MKMKKCDNCGMNHLATQQDGNFIDGGLSLDLLNMGHYGGLWDNFPPEDRGGLVHLCHDCSLILVRALPAILHFALPGGKGGHPNNVHRETSDRGTETPPCCELAWTWNQVGESRYEVETYYGTAEGEWVKDDRPYENE